MSVVRCDHVVVATGKCSSPRMPATVLQNLRGFSGEVRGVMLLLLLVLVLLMFLLLFFLRRDYHRSSFVSVPRPRARYPRPRPYTFPNTLLQVFHSSEAKALASRAASGGGICIVGMGNSACDLAVGELRQRHAVFRS